MEGTNDSGGRPPARIPSPAAEQTGPRASMTASAAFVPGLRGGSQAEAVSIERSLQPTHAPPASSNIPARGACGPQQRALRLSSWT